MSTPVRASARDLRALAAIVSVDRPDLPDGEGLPPSLLAEMKGQIRCDGICFMGFDSGRHKTWVLQALPALEKDDLEPGTDLDLAHWAHYWDSQPCSHPDRTGDVRSVLKIADFYSARQWRSTGMYCDVYRSLGIAHELQLCLPDPAGRAAGPGRTIRMFFNRQSGPDFSERDRALLTLLRPHLHQAFLDAERRRHPVPQLTPRQTELLYLVAAGHTNTQIARRLGISEATVRSHLEHIHTRLHVSSRTAAVTRAFADRIA